MHEHHLLLQLSVVAEWEENDKMIPLVDELYSVRCGN